MSSVKIEFLEMKIADLESQLAWYEEQNKKLRAEVQRKNAEMTSLELRSAEIIKNSYDLRIKLRNVFIENDKQW
jgi:predicted RNase H-like nuclease (RuvC/YqgF family)